MKEPKQKTSVVNELSGADNALSEALRVSFVILKWIMLLLILVFLASGFRTVEPGERALVLRFGKIRRVGENGILKPGLIGPLPWLHWVFPYPIDEIVKVPVDARVSLPINTFWYFQPESELVSQKPQVYIRPKLHPIIDGYCITRSDEKGEDTAFGGDYNIVHSKWKLIYRIKDPERFFKNIYVEMDNLQSGQNYADVITENVTPLLEKMLADSVVTAMVNFTIEEAISSKDTIPQHIKRLLQKKLNQMESGILVESVQLIDAAWPRQVNNAFLAFIKVSQESPKVITEAESYAEKILYETAGMVAEELLAIIGKSDPESRQKAEMLWAQLAGSAQGEIAEARAYRTRVVEAAKANADYLRQLLPEYRKRPKLVMQKIYQDAIEQVLNNAQEKMIIQPTEGTRGKEIRIQLNRDPTLKQKGQNSGK